MFDLSKINVIKNGKTSSFCFWAVKERERERKYMFTFSCLNSGGGGASSSHNNKSLSYLCAIHLATSVF